MDSGQRLFGDLFFVAWKRAEIAVLDSITLTQIAERVGAELGETYATQTALGWRRGSKPRATVIRAIAKALGADEAALQAAKRGASMPRQLDAGETEGPDPRLVRRFPKPDTRPATRKGVVTKGRGKRGV